jgi:Fic family protein
MGVPDFGRYCPVGSIQYVAKRAGEKFPPEDIEPGARDRQARGRLDTGAIEGLYEVDRGFTYTVAFETAAWEVELAKKGENVRPLFEAQLHAYDYVLDLATKAEPISEAAIRVLHEVVCRAQATHRVMTAVGPQEQALTRGRYKVLPNHVRTRDGVDHSYAPVDVTPRRCFGWSKNCEARPFMAAHPVLQAAYAHYGLVVIHPFADGNGRVARALASAFTYRAISMPIVILSEHKEAYLDSLEAADRSDYQSFVDFMLARALDTIALVNESVLGALSPSAEKSMEAIKSLYLTKGGYTHDQVEASGTRFIQTVRSELLKTISKNTVPKVHGGAEILPGASGYPKMPVTDDDVQLSLERGDQQALSTKGEIVLTSRMDELVPSISGVLYIRLSLFADRIVGEALAEMKPFAEKSLRGQP